MPAPRIQITTSFESSMACTKPLCHGRFRWKKASLFSGIASLYDHELILDNRKWKRSVQIRILLRRLFWVQWFPRSKHATNLHLHMNNGSLYRLYVESAGWWKYALEEQCAAIGNRYPQNKKWKGLWKKPPKPAEYTVRQHWPPVYTLGDLRDPHTPQALKDIHAKMFETPPIFYTRMNSSDKVATWLASMGYDIHDSQPSQGQQMLAIEAEKWGLTAEQLEYIIERGGSPEKLASQMDKH